jgi:Tfp pilus assembly protein PilF
MRAVTSDASQSPRFPLTSLRFYVAVALLLLPRVPSTAAQEQVNGVVAGRVTDPRGQPQSVLVSLVAGGEILVGQVYTESNGNFSFSNLHSGLYYVTVEAPGYRPAREGVMIDARSSSKTQVNISLEPVGPGPAPPNQIIAGSPASYRLNFRANHRPFDARVLNEFDKGNQKQRNGDWRAAVSHYRKALRIDPGFYPALNNMGVTALRRKQPAEAEGFFMKSLAVNPDDGEAYINLGHVLYEQAKYQPAMERLEEGLKRSPESSVGHFFLGSVYLKLGDLEKAEKDLKTACALDPAGMASAHLQLANVYLRRHDMRAAGAQLREYLQANPSDPQGPAIKKLLANIGANETK